MAKNRPRFFSLSRSLRFLLSLATLACAVPPLAAAGEPARVSLTLLGTTDLHGNIEPVDYYENKPANRGLAKVATLIRKVRAERANTLLLDSGDTIQGTPLAYYFARKDLSQPNPMIVEMNALGYDAMAVGNHEFNFGLDVLWKAKREAKFPILAANLKQQYKDGVEYFQPYLIKRVAGVRVGIVGFVTPGVPRWEIPAHYRGYEFEPIVKAAKRVIPEVRKQVDLLVVIAHSGLERNPDTGQPFDLNQIPEENRVYALAEQVPGIDVILFGHTHKELKEEFIHGVLLAQALHWGQSLARADVEMEKTDTGWQVSSKHSTTLPVTDAVPPDPEVVKIARPYHQATQAYLDKPIANSPQAMDALTARYESHPLMDVLHAVQREAGNADISFATMFYPKAKIPAGKVTMRQVAGLYIYENTLYTVEMTGAQVKAALEHSASFFPSWPFPGPHAPRLPGYNTDSAGGVSYTIDLSQPVGRRVRELAYKGKPLDPAAKLRVAINNYRYSGGGRYDVFRGLPVLYRSAQEIRELLIEYVARSGSLPTTASGNWQIVPGEAREIILRDARGGRHDSVVLVNPVLPRRLARDFAWFPFVTSHNRTHARGN